MDNVSFPLFSLCCSDLGLKKNRMASNKRDAKILREDIRDLELDIDDAARLLRKTRSQVQFAQDLLAELEDRHWAVLSLYDPALAKEGVAQAIRELEEQEPAARIQNRSNDSVVRGSGANESGSSSTGSQS